MSYEIEDIIDDFKQHNGEKGENSRIVSKIIECLKTLWYLFRIASQIKEIKTAVCETSERHKRYKLDIPPSSDVGIDPRVVALYTDASNLVGMEGPTNELVNWLTDEEKLKVVSIVGFGGLGKTTLANEVYRKLKGKFDCGAFVPVSQKPNIRKLLCSLLSQFGIEPSIHAGESHLIDKIREHLQAKRYLIIIDDIWSVEAWGVIKCAFPENDLGSRVIATTRIQDVAKACCSHPCDYILKMKPLSNEESRRLFFGRIFGLEEACPHQLKDVSVEILKKCGGLPLAINSISSMLASEGSNQKERWEHLRNSLGSGTNLMLEGNLTLKGMRQILNLSYKNLPRHLKTCLLYLGMYPEDCLIKRFDLERQWIAEGFVSKEHGRDVDKAARNYFNELVNRSLVQLVEDPDYYDEYEPDLKFCRVHDMMLDLILCKSAEENFMTIVDDPNAITGMHHKARRLSFRLDSDSNGAILPGNMSMSQVRSLMIFGSYDNLPPVSEFKSLRVLSVDCGEMDLNDMCKLYHLRYFKSGRGNHKLPSQIRGLHHLETLDLADRFDESNIPSDIVHLPRLSHLHVGHYARLADGIGNMKFLRYLVFELDMNSLDNIKGLGELTNLRYLYVCDHGADDMERRIDVLCSSLEKNCSYIEHLALDIYVCIDGLMALSCPPRRLETLHLSSCWFSRVPNWMEELHNLRELRLQVRELLKDGVGILAELPALIDVDLWIRRSVREMIVIYGRAFPVLKRFSLRLSSVSYLTFQAGAMPMLQKLEVDFNAEGSEQNWAGPVGIEHLLALEEVSAVIECGDATESEKRSTELALGSAIDTHPNHPRIKIRCLDTAIEDDDYSTED